VARTLTIALLGTRFMGRAHSQAWFSAPRFFDLPRSPVLGVVAGRDPSATTEFAARWGWGRATTDWREAVADPAVDLVDIGTPNDLHRDQAVAALEAGKHVACEKPLAGTLEDARVMARAAGRSSGRTYVWYTYRRVPAVALARRLVTEGRLGRIYHVRAAYLQDWGGSETPLVWRFRGKVAGTGAHGDLGAHIIDMARFVTGDEIVEVAGAIEQRFITERPLPDDPGRTGRSTVDDAVLFLARFKGGAVATFESTRLATGHRNSNRIEVNGDRGAVRFDFARMNQLDFFDATRPARLQGWTTIAVTNPDHPYMGAWWPDGHGLGYEHTFTNQAADILRDLGGRKPEAPLPDFADAFVTQRVMEAALRSARERMPVRMTEID
jgi:predicted dehydrogenase